MKVKKKLQNVIGIMLIIALTTLMPVDVLQAKTKEVTAASKINRVTVFPGHANVERVSKHMWEKGMYTLVFSHLPADIIDSSIRVSGKGTAEAKILNVKT